MKPKGSMTHIQPNNVAVVAENKSASQSMHQKLYISFCRFFFRDKFLHILDIIFYYKVCPFVVVNLFLKSYLPNKWTNSINLKCKWYLGSRIGFARFAYLSFEMNYFIYLWIWHIYAIFINSSASHSFSNNIDCGWTWCISQYTNNHI